MQRFGEFVSVGPGRSAGSAALIVETSLFIEAIEVSDRIGVDAPNRKRGGIQLVACHKARTRNAAI